MKATHLIIVSLLIGALLASECYQGEYWSTKTNGCEQCHISCNSCNSDQGCLTCYDQMYLTTKGNKIECDLCYNIMENCQICVSAQKCKKCTNGYFLDGNNQCQTCHHYQPYCLFCFQNSTFLQCIACNMTHRLVDGRCVPKDPNFKEPVLLNNSNKDPENKPKQQQAAQPSNNGSNSPKPQQTPQTAAPLKKQQQQQSNQSAYANAAGVVVVVECNSNQIKLRDVCILIIPFCQTYDSATLKCKECQIAFTLNSGGFCIPEILLASQNGGLGSVPTTIPAGSGNVQGVAPTFEMAQKPEDCTSDQYYWWGRCVTVGTECKQKDTDDQCVQCVPGYEVNQGICSQVDPTVLANPSTPSSYSAVARADPISDSAQLGTPKKADEQGNDGTALPEAAPQAFPEDPVVEVQSFTFSTNCNRGNKCETCEAEFPDFCKTCIKGYTTVDKFPGRCFPDTI